jgi:ParB-like chromosome segregation protein Spo0J
MNDTTDGRSHRVVRLTVLVLDEELQPRADFDEDHLEALREAIAHGEQLPPLVVFNDGEKLWLADGFHRHRVYRALGLTEAECTVIEGSRADALRYSLSANAKHGLRPNRSDLRRSYQLALKYGLLDTTSAHLTAETAELLGCSDRWARELTADDRDRAQEQRDAEIARLKGEGKSTREIARETGIPRSTVARGVPKRNSADLGHPVEPSDVVEPSDTVAPFDTDNHAVTAVLGGAEKRKTAEFPHPVEPNAPADPPVEAAPQSTPAPPPAPATTVMPPRTPALAAIPRIRTATSPGVRNLEQFENVVRAILEACTNAQRAPVPRDMLPLQARERASELTAAIDHVHALVGKLEAIATSPKKSMPATTARGIRR